MQSQYVYFETVLEICCECYRNGHLDSLNMVTAMVEAKAYSLGYTYISRGYNYKCHRVLRFSILQIGGLCEHCIRPGDNSNG